jgi:acyl carrier protein
MTVEQIFSEVFSIPANTVQDSLDFRQIAAWDSMAHMTLIARIEEAYKIELTGDEIADLRSVRDVRAILRHRGVVS